MQALSLWFRAVIGAAAETAGLDERGASMVEYALLLALIAVVCIVAVGFIGTNASGKFNTVANSLS